MLSGSDTLTVTVNANPANKAIDFGGTNAFVTLGPAPGLGASRFTIETWFRRDGAGIATFTGTGGVIAIPLVTKGMAEVDDVNNRDMNYFLGIRQSDGVLVADFEDTATGGNHPVAGVTPVVAGPEWHHAAVTYDGTTWRLYLDGQLDRELVVGAFTPRSDSIQHAAIGTALNSTGGVGSQPQGFFNGVLDESRIWNYARTPQQITRGRLLEIGLPTPGLLGRWGLNEGAGSGRRQQHRWRQRDGGRIDLVVDGGRAVYGRQSGPGSGGRPCGDRRGSRGDDRRARQRQRRRRRRADARLGEQPGARHRDRERRRDDRLYAGGQLLSAPTASATRSTTARAGARRPPSA